MWETEKKQEQVEAGKRWLEETLQRSGKELNFPVENLRWEQAPDDPDQHILYFNMQSKSEHIPFAESNLQVLSTTESLQAKFETLIRNKLKSLT